MQISQGKRQLWKAAVLVLLPGVGLLHAQPVINTVAGMGRTLVAGSVPATSLQLADPVGMAFDSAGNLYVADNQQSVVFKISPAGIATVFAGNGSKGFSGDGGPATAAGLLEPMAVAADVTGNIYVADFHNQRIRKVDRNGTITTFAGGGATYEGDGIPATSSTVFEPDGVAVDSSGSLYIAEGGTARIRKVTPDGIIHNIGNANSLPSGYSGDNGPASQAQFNVPQGLAVDRKGNLYIADRNNNRVRKIDTNGIVTTFVGNGQEGHSGDGGLATAAALTLPEALAFDAQGNLYIADTYNRVVRQVTPGGIISTVAGNASTYPPAFSGDGGPATLASFILPDGVAVDSFGSLYISDQGDRLVRQVNGSGIINTFAGNGVSNFSGDGGLAQQAALDYPADVKVDSGGNLYIADAMNHRVRKVTPAGIITIIAGNGTPGFSGDGGLAINAQLNTPVSVAVDISGNVYIVDSLNFRVRRVTPGGVINTYLVGTIAGHGVPAGVAADAAGNLYVSDSYLNWVVKVTPSGGVSTIAGTGTAGSSGDGGPATQAMLNAPQALTLDPAGNLYITDSQNRLVRKVTPGGTITTVAGAGNLPASSDFEGVAATQLYIDYPTGLAADGNGDLYLQGSWSVYRVNPAGVISLLVGGGLFGYQEGFAGDGGPSVAARLVRDSCSISSCMGMGLDAAGNLYFADSGNDRIRKITNPGGFPAQMTISNPSFNWLPAPQIVPTGGDQWDFNLYPTNLNNSGPNTLVLTNSGAGAMPWSATVSTLDGTNWLNLSANSGSAPASIVLSANGDGLTPGLYMGTVTISAPNASNSPRYVTGTLQVDPSSFSAAAGTGTLVISEPPGVGWTVTSSADWITITSSRSGIGLGSIHYAVAENTSGSPRSGSLALENTTAGTPTFTVNQGTDLPAAIAPTGGSGQSTQTNAAFAVALEATVTDSGGNPVSGVAVSFSAPGAGASGTFGGSVTATVMTNALGVATAPAFTANGIAGSYTVTATAAGVPSTASFALTNTSGSCSIGLSPQSASLPSTGTSTVETCPNDSGQPTCGVLPETPRSFSVTPGAGCGAWTATSSNPAALQITSGTSGSGTGSVSYVLLTNTHNSAQSYSITVSSGATSATYSISQAGNADSKVYRQVYALYEQLLGRDPDASGFTFWSGSGGAGLGQMADSFLTSPEAYNSDFAVMAAYQAATGSPPTFAQFTASVASLRGALTVAGLFNSLAGSGYSAADLYQNLLNRAPGVADSSCYAVTLSQCFQTIIGYPAGATPVRAPNNEFQNTGIYQTAPDHSNGLYVQMVYYVTVSRNPDPSGFAFWLGVANRGGPGLLFQGSAGYPARIQILGPGTPNQGFIGSPEFQGLFAN